MNVDIHLPFYISAGAAATGLVLVALTWGESSIRTLTRRPVPS